MARHPGYARRRNWLLVTAIPAHGQIEKQSETFG
jgi:hypothetical protein